jgi:hypothetical protein
MAGKQEFTKPGATRSDLEVAWQDRLADAQALFDAGRHAWAIATALYALEIRLKVLICKRLDVPDLPKAFETHDLDSLLLLAGLSKRIEKKQCPEREGQLGKDPQAGGDAQRDEIPARRRLDGGASRRSARSPHRPVRRSAVMIVEATMKPILRRAIQVFRDYAQSQGWGPDEYRIYLRPNLEWLKVSFVLVAKAFPSQDYHENYLAIDQFVKKELKDDPSLRRMIGFSLLTFDQVAQGGAYSIPSTYFDADDL